MYLHKEGEGREAAFLYHRFLVIISLIYLFDFFDFMDKIALLADEELLIRDGGEMPEVTFHSSIYYLTEDAEGPQINLNDDDLKYLKQAVIKGYSRIILRDLEPENRDQGHYRGLERCRVNWQRLARFCACEQLDVEGPRGEIIAALKNFMIREVAEVREGLRCSSVNCSSQAISSLLDNLGLGPDELPEGWQNICL